MFAGLASALERERVSYIVVGALARVIVGADETTPGLDITPSATDENLRRLERALESIGAHRPDGSPPALDQVDYENEPVIELQTDCGEVKVVPYPAGSRGYDDLRRDAERQPIGRGLRPSVASPADLARMLNALGREEDRAKAPLAAQADRDRTRAPPRTLDRTLTTPHGLPSAVTEPRLAVRTERGGVGGNERAGARPALSIA